MTMTKFYLYKFAIAIGFIAATTTVYGDEVHPKQTGTFTAPITMYYDTQLYPTKPVEQKKEGIVITAPITMYYDAMYGVSFKK